jgi:hypothetical protein
VSVILSAGLILWESTAQAVRSNLELTNKNPAQKAGFFLLKRLHIFKKVVRYSYLGISPIPPLPQQTMQRSG